MWPENLVTPTACRTETVQKIVREREDIWFKTPCTVDRVGDYTAAVQRTLRARGYYHGRITGEVVWGTRRAIRKYQVENGLDSTTLSLASARQLGLVAVERQVE